MPASARRTSRSDDTSNLRVAVSSAKRLTEPTLPARSAHSRQSGNNFDTPLRGGLESRQRRLRSTVPVPFRPEVLPVADTMACGQPSRCQARQAVDRPRQGSRPFGQQLRELAVALRAAPSPERDQVQAASAACPRCGSMGLWLPAITNLNCGKYRRKSRRYSARTPVATGDGP